MPARRLGWNSKARRWFEWGVGLRSGKFVWEPLGPLSDENLAELTQSLAAVGEMVPDGFTMEASPTARNWWKRAANALARGKLLAFDYGYTSDELLFKTGGTLRAYNRHHLATDILEAPGEQDITAGVNFSAIQAEGEKLGLVTETFSSQSVFLTGIFERAFASANKNETWLLENRRQFQTLIHPEHLGASFRVLVQGRSD